MRSRMPEAGSQVTASEISTGALRKSEFSFFSLKSFLGESWPSWSPLSSDLSSHVPPSTKAGSQVTFPGTLTGAPRKLEFSFFSLKSFFAESWPNWSPLSSDLSPHVPPSTKTGSQVTFSGILTGAPRKSEFSFFSLKSFFGESWPSWSSLSSDSSPHVPQSTAEAAGWSISGISLARREISYWSAFGISLARREISDWEIRIRSISLTAMSNPGW